MFSQVGLYYAFDCVLYSALNVSIRKLKLLFKPHIIRKINERLSLRVHEISVVLIP